MCCCLSVSLNFMFWLLRAAIFAACVAVMINSLKCAHIYFIFACSFGQKAHCFCGFSSLLLFASTWTWTICSQIRTHAHRFFNNKQVFPRTQTTINVRTNRTRNGWFSVLLWRAKKKNNTKNRCSHLALFFLPSQNVHLITYSQSHKRIMKLARFFCHEHSIEKGSTGMCVVCMLESVK